MLFNNDFSSRAPVSYAANYSIVTETGNNNSANIMQTGDKHVQKLPKMAIIMVSVGIKTKRLLPVW
jgi:hypothetical protein